MPAQPIKGFGFPLRFGPLGHFERAEGTTKIKANMQAIVLTSKGERVQRSGFGTLGLQAVMGNIDQVMCTFLETEIRTAIAKDEPRAQVVGVMCQPDIDSNGHQKLKINVRFRVRATGVFDELAVEVT